LGRNLCDARPWTAAALIDAATTDQGFGIRFHGKPSHAGEDFEGLALIRTKE
jgi:hypothetical protein